MTTFSPWLPTEALKPAHFERAMTGLVADWASHWISKAKPNCRTRLREIGSPEPGRLAWRRWGEDCSISIDQSGRRALAEAMLERQVTAESIKPADRPLFDDLTDRCLDDLIGRLSWLIDQERNPTVEEGEPNFHGGISWEIGLKRSGSTIGLTVHRPALVRWRKALAPAAVKPALGSTGRALAGQQLRVDIHAGQGPLSLAELENLAIGDVVVLDCPVEASLELMVGGRPTGIRGKLVSEVETTHLEITERKRAST